MMKYFVDEVRRLSNEGYYNKEIADQLGCHPLTISRCKERHNIPRPNLSNRKDKIQACKSCNKEEYIARKERKRKYCKECFLKIREKRKEEKRLYMRSKK